MVPVCWLSTSVSNALNATDCVANVVPFLVIGLNWTTDRVEAEDVAAA